MFSVITVCTGNICRSPMAEYQLRDYLAKAGLFSRACVDSAAITSWEQGQPMDRRAQRTLAQHDIPSTTQLKTLADHRARKFQSEWFPAHDLILALDSGHYEYLMERSPDKERSKIRMLRDFDREFSETAPDSRLKEKSIADPWYGDMDNFRETYELIDGSLDGLVEYIKLNA